ncbi:hypothetical protein AB6A23_03910 [Paenibacillus tarimensis]
MKEHVQDLRYYLGLDGVRTCSSLIYFRLVHIEKVNFALFYVIGVHHRLFE